MDTSGSNIKLLARVSELLQEELLISERNEVNNKWDDVIRLLCGQLGTIKGELNNVKNHNKTLGQQKLVCILAVGLYNHIALLSYEYQIWDKLLVEVTHLNQKYDDKLRLALEEIKALKLKNKQLKVTQKTQFKYNYEK